MTTPHLSAYFKSKRLLYDGIKAIGSESGFPHILSIILVGEVL